MDSLRDMIIVATFHEIVATSELIVATFHGFVSTHLNLNLHKLADIFKSNFLI